MLWSELSFLVAELSLLEPLPAIGVETVRALVSAGADVTLAVRNVLQANASLVKLQRTWNICSITCD